jgi:hypothetical protein
LAAFLWAVSPSSSSSAAFSRTQRLKEWYFSLKALRVAFDFPRSSLHSALASLRSDWSGLAVAAAGRTSAATRPVAIRIVFMWPETHD